ncbi:MAG: FAD-dependent oxidoreductase [Anaerolineales bacterium]|nr:FAD-dependent oxidoreductase [Anaerolineales bacterium]
MPTPASARLVIVGAGIVGVSAAYHLARLGWRDVLVLDKGPLFENDGSTSHAPGGVVALSHNLLLTRMAQYSSDLYRGLAPYTPDRNHYNAVGGLELALSARRFTDLRRLHNEGLSFGAESHLLTPAETKAKLPLLDDTRIAGSLFVPKSAIIAGAHVAAALARDAAAEGAVTFLAGTEVTEIEARAGRVTAVLTNHPDRPRIPCEAVLLCTNIWGPVLADRLGVALPLLAFEHQYVQTGPLPALARFDRARRDDEIVFPTARELDSSIYFRQHWDGYGIGNYWHAPRPVRPADVGRTALRPFTTGDFTRAWEQVQTLLPAVRGAALTRSFNGLFAFPVDGLPLVGPTPVAGLWTAVGSWITHAGGVGKSVAEWLTHGEPEWDMRQVDVRRFHGFQTTRAYIDVVCNKNYAELYDIVHPRQPVSKPRDLRLSPFHARWQALGAVFTTFAGLELPNWFAANAPLLEKYDRQIPDRAGWAAGHWSRLQGAEHLATRETAALYDLTGLSILEAKGPGALAFVNTLCSNQLDKPAGSVVYTLWLTGRGGVRRDLAVARLSDDCFWLFVGEGTRPLDRVWVETHRPPDGAVTVTDRSDEFTALGLWGPRARAVLARVSPADLDNAAFPYFTARWIEIGHTPVLALRVSYVGELGWELHIPNDQALPVFDALWEAGREAGLVAAGMGAFDSLRLEKGYRLWGGDMDTEQTPYEAGLGWTVRLSKPAFIGREACRQLQGRLPARQLVCLAADDPQAVALGNEPIFAAGAPVGRVTSANFGYSVGRFLAYGYVPAEHAALGTRLEVGYFDQRFSATVAADPQFDPPMRRLKA